MITRLIFQMIKTLPDFSCIGKLQYNNIKRPICSMKIRRQSWNSVNWEFT